MAKVLDWEETKVLKERILKEDKAKTVFFVNNIETCDYGKDYVVYALPGVYFLLWKKTSVVVFSDGQYDARKAAEFLKTIEFSALNGMAEYTDPLVPYLEEMGFENHPSQMMYVDHESFKKIPRRDGLRLLLAPEDFEKVADLYATSEEFNLHLEDELDKEDWACDMAEKEYPFASVGFFVKKRLVACSYLAAYSRRSAMVVGVYVHPDYENGGIGTAMMSELTDLALNENLMDFLTLFYSTEKARHVYEKIGYRVIGSHNFFKKKTN